jgi:O-acetyl-ADP-ribose deacetylase
LQQGLPPSHAGVNGAISAAAGPDYAAECAQLAARAAGAEVLVTGAGALPARYLIHAVSPRWRGGDRDKEALRRVHEHLLRVAVGHECSSVALPAIGAGAHRFPPEVAASIAVPTVEAFLEDDSTLERVVFFFQTRAILHDYLAHSSHSEQRDVLVAWLRDEITGHLREAGRTQLVEAVDEITDEPTLRAIIAEAHEAAWGHHHGDDGSGREFSVGSNIVYVRAVERVLNLGARVE